MSDDTKTVPEPNEARRDEQDPVRYHQVDETNVGDADRPQSPHPDEARRPEGGE